MYLDAYICECECLYYVGYLEQCDHHFRLLYYEESEIVEKKASLACMEVSFFAGLRLTNIDS